MLRGMQLYHDPQARSVRPLILLEELGVDYDLVPVSLQRGEHKTAEFLRLHPLGQLPVLVDDDQVLFESVAICLYLADRYPDAGWCPAPGSQERGVYYQWGVFVAGSLEPAMAATYLEMTGTRPVPGTPSLADVLTALARALEHHDYLLPSGPSTADVLVGATLAFLPDRGIGLPDPLSDYVSRLRSRPAFRRGLGG